MLALLIRRGHWCDAPIERLQHEARAALERETFHLRDALQGESWPDVAARLAETHPDSGDILHAARMCWSECRELSSGEATWPEEALPASFSAEAKIPEDWAGSPVELELWLDGEGFVRFSTGCQAP